MADELKITASRNMASWLTAQNVSLAVTSYQTGQLFLIGHVDNVLSVNHSQYPVCMGLDYDPDADELTVATASQLWRLVGGPGEGQFDRCYSPRSSVVIGDVDPHEVSGRLFVNTELSCIANADTRRAVWRPAWIDRLAPEDRCHLNGMCARDGEPQYATAISRSNVVGGWRDRRADGGVLVDCRSGDVLWDNLSMPHSPREMDGDIYVLNSGTGDLLRNGAPVAWFPGFLRGLALRGDYAAVGLSLPRNQLFSGLQLDANLKSRSADPWCGVQIANLQTGNVEHWLRFDSGVREIFSVCLITGVRCPQAVGLNEQCRVSYTEAA